MNSIIEAELANIRSLALRADYKSALPRIRKLRLKFNSHFRVEFTYAKIVGDYADELPEKAKKRLKKEASAILSRLVRRLNGQTPDVRFGVRINYYYQLGSFDKLERVGKQLSKTDRKKGLYSSGLGASLEAERLLRSKSGRTTSERVAGRAVKYWKEYFSLQTRETYYFPYTLLAMAEAILGNEPSMNRALDRAAKLSSRRSDYWEFVEIRALLQGANP